MRNANWNWSIWCRRPYHVIDQIIPSSHSGTIVFLLYIQDLHNICNSPLPFICVNDNNCFISETNLPQTGEVLNLELREYPSGWMLIHCRPIENKKNSYLFCFYYQKNYWQQWTFHGRIPICPIPWYQIRQQVRLKTKLIAYIPGEDIRDIGILLNAMQLLDSDATQTLCYSFTDLYSLKLRSHIACCHSATSLRQNVRVVAGRLQGGCKEVGHWSPTGCRRLKGRFGHRKVLVAASETSLRQNRL